MSAASAGNLGLDYVRAPEKPIILRRSIGKGLLGIARVRCDVDNLGMIDPPAIEDALLVSLKLCSFHADVWVDGKPSADPVRSAGLVSLYDYRCNLQVNLRAAFDTVNFHISRSVLDGLAHDLVGGRVSDLTVKQGSCLDDPVIRSLGAAVLPALENPESANLLFLDHIGWALAAHVAKAYGDAVPMTSRGGLAPWQERRAKEMMATQLDGNVRLADLAAACGLSTGHFVRAFRCTTNTTPYRWLLQLRLEQAQALMAGTSLPLASIALQCGFADQSHFTRTFNRILGVSPGLWRRNRRPGSPDGDMALKAALGTGATLVTKEGFTA